MKLGIIFAKHLFSLLIILSYQSVTATQNPQNSAQSVVEFDVPYELFVALSDYHDLTQLEEQHHIDKEIIPVITEIIYYFTEEIDKYLVMPDISDKIKVNLEKINSHLIDFKNELLFRKKVVEFRALLKQQQQLKSSQ
ncbi:MAG: hypothetical protein KAG43_07760 [Candidatus Marithrix sp.]|nr:hypothetical protein [Candidatus Marithrix sp.]